MKSGIPLIVSSCDKCSDLWQSFFWLLKKNWTGFDRKVYLCTDSKVFSYEGLDIDCPLRMPPGSTWSENLLTLLNHIDEEYVLFMLDDFWLKSQVDVDGLQQYEDIIQTDDTIGFICLIHQIVPSVENPLSADYSGLIEYGMKTPYRVTTQAGLWRKDYLNSLLRRYESAWWFEMFGSKRSRHSKYCSYVVEESVFDYDESGVLFRGSYIREHVDEFMDDSNVVLNPSRRIDSMDRLKSEIKPLGLWQKLNPRFLYFYVKSHF